MKMRTSFVKIYNIKAFYNWKRKKRAEDFYGRDEHHGASFPHGGLQAFRGWPVTGEIKSLLLCYLLHTRHASRARLASRKGTILDKGRAQGSKGWLRCQRAQAVFGTLAHSPRWPAEAAIWLAHDILFRIIGPGSLPASALWAGMTEVEHVCSESTDLSDATAEEPSLSIFSMVPFPDFQVWTTPRQGRTKDGLMQLLLGENKQMNEGTSGPRVVKPAQNPDVISPVIDVYHHCQQQKFTLY